MEMSIEYQSTHRLPSGRSDTRGEANGLYSFGEPCREAFARPSLRERKKLQTRAAIIRRAVELFNTQGFYNTSIDDIADAADVSRGTFFNYFGYKEAVIVEFGRDLMIN